MLDVIFGTSCARDIDVFFMRSDAPPKRDRVNAWLAQHQLPAARRVETTPVDSLDDCSGGGSPRLSYERWHLRYDGQLYTLEDTDEETGDPFGAAYITRVVRLDSAVAKTERTTVLHSIDGIPDDQMGAEYLDKVLEKMKRYPSLHDAEIERQLNKRRSEIHLLSDDPAGESST